MKTKSEVWFEKLCDMWLRKASEEIGELVAEDFKYFENPFAEPITDVEILQAQWAEVKEQNIEVLEIVPLVCTDAEGTARYHFVAEIAGELHESKGAYFVKLNDEGRAVEFRQWWIEK